MSDLGRQIERHLAEVTRRGASPHTRAAYRPISISSVSQ